MTMISPPNSKMATRPSLRTWLRLVPTWLVVLICHAGTVPPANADAWPTFRKDAGRSGYAATALEAPRLQQQWTWSSPQLPLPAWDGPARWDAYATIRDLPAMRSYDTCFHTVSDGRMVFFGSSSQDTLFALDLESGKPAWTYTAGGPIRLSPTLDGGRVYFGCDDGFAYCLEVRTGKLVWRFSPSDHAQASARRVPNNDRLISMYPIRTGVTIRDGVAYFAASLLPWRESFLCGVDAKTGKMAARGTFSVEHEDATLEGSILIAEDRLIVPQGRVAPLLFKRGSGQKIGSLPGGGGVTIVLTEAGDVVRTEGGKEARAGQIGVFRGKERVASFPRGRAIVVRPNAYYVIDQEKLFAADRVDNQLRWQRTVDEPLEIIMAGDTLFVGGRDHVTAVNSTDGNVTWSAAVSGRATGLAIVNRRLLVSTDTGNIYCFAPTSRQPWTDATVHQQQPDEDWKSPPVAKVRNRDLLHRWVFHRTAMKTPEGTPVSQRTVGKITVQDQTGACHATLSGGGAEVIKVGPSAGVEAIQLKGSLFPLPQEMANALPADVITVEAWVRVDEATEWGAILGCFQDDGSTEHGWLLGYRTDRFCMAVAGQGGGLTYLTSDTPFKLKTWNHVVGTYNGREIRLYVNGSLAASSQAESGPISYPQAQERFFTLAGYRDANESFPLVGALHEVRVYATAMGASQIRRLAAARASEFATPAVSEHDNQFLAWGPVAKFVHPGAVEITFGTIRPLKTTVNLITDQAVQPFEESKSVIEHKILVDNLPKRREVQFQIRESTTRDESGAANVSSSFVLDTHFDWAMEAVSELAPWTKELIRRAPNPRGLAVLVGAELSDRAIELAQGTEFSVMLVVPEWQQAQMIRDQWLADGLPYGVELCVANQSLENLPAAFATVVVAPEDTRALRRIVRPDGGILSDGTNVLWQREPLAGAGDWSHMYGVASNSAFGGESLGGATRREDLVTQWIGRPGPRYQTDRGNRKPSPLAAGGRLYLQGQQRMIALDAFSGSVLWTMETPTVMRLNVPHDCANWCADSRGLYVAAEDRAWMIDGTTGKIAEQYRLPPTKRPWRPTVCLGIHRPGRPAIDRQRRVLCGDLYQLVGWDQLV